MGARRLQMEPELDDQAAAGAFRRLVAHLQAHPEVQNIELMNLAGFCRNCLAKWYAAESAAHGVTIDDARARELIYGMPYAQWKARYQI